MITARQRELILRNFYDTQEFVEFFGISMEELIDAFAEKIEERSDEIDQWETDGYITLEGNEESY